MIFLFFFLVFLFTLILNMSWVDLNLIPGENLALYTTLFIPKLETLRILANDISILLVKGKDT